MSYQQTEVRLREIYDRLEVLTMYRTQLAGLSVQDKILKVSDILAEEATLYDELNSIEDDLYDPDGMTTTPRELYGWARELRERVGQFKAVDESLLANSVASMHQKGDRPLGQFLRNGGGRALLLMGVTACLVGFGWVYFNRYIGALHPVEHRGPTFLERQL